MQQAPALNMISRATIGNYLQHGNVGDADCVVAFAFGYRQVGNMIQPGLSNQQLAKYLNERYFRLPKIVQFEIADALPRLTHELYRVERHRQAGAYLDTREVAVQAKEIMDQRGWKKAIIIGHPYHMPRADAVCQRLGMETVAPGGLNLIGFDPNSAQKWTQNATNWHEHEAKAIEHYASKEWV